jgi:hypothetical protein
MRSEESAGQGRALPRLLFQARRPPVVGLFIAICPLWLAGRGISARVYERSGGNIFAANSLKCEIILSR